MTEECSIALVSSLEVTEAKKEAKEKETTSSEMTVTEAIGALVTRSFALTYATRAHEKAPK